jgi:hypothetical protein
MSGRWEGDDRGRGVAEAPQLAPGARELVDAFSQPGWVAEDPELHLRPHVDDWCVRDGRFELVDAHVDDSGAYVLRLHWRGATGSVGKVRAAAFCLIGSFAESATYVRQRRVSRDGDDASALLRFEVGTGELAPDTRFLPHGHAVVLDVAGVL